jgi:hypothetical protein
MGKGKKMIKVGDEVKWGNQFTFSGKVINIETDPETGKDWAEIKINTLTGKRAGIFVEYLEKVNQNII